MNEQPINARARRDPPAVVVTPGRTPPPTEYGEDVTETAADPTDAERDAKRRRRTDQKARARRRGHRAKARRRNR